MGLKIQCYVKQWLLSITENWKIFLKEIKGSLLHYIQWTEAYGGQKNLCDLSLSAPSAKTTSKGVLTHNYIHVFDKCTISNCQICQQYKGHDHVIEVKK